MVALGLPRPAPPEEGLDVLGVEVKAVSKSSAARWIGRAERGLRPPGGGSCGCRTPVVGLGRFVGTAHGHLGRWLATGPPSPLDVRTARPFFLTNSCSSAVSGSAKAAGTYVAWTRAPPISAIVRSGPDRPRRKHPVGRQHRLNSSPLSHGHGSLRPSFSQSSLSPWTTRRPRLTWASLRIPPTPPGHQLESRPSSSNRSHGTPPQFTGRIGDDGPPTRIEADSDCPRRQTTRRLRRGSAFSEGPTSTTSRSACTTSPSYRSGLRPSRRAKRSPVSTGSFIRPRSSRPSPSPPPTPSRIASGAVACTGIPAGSGRRCGREKARMSYQTSPLARSHSTRNRSSPAPA